MLFSLMGFLLDLVRALFIMGVVAATIYLQRKARAEIQRRKLQRVLQQKKQNNG
mgnify:CR=1 FL=1